MTIAKTDDFFGLRVGDCRKDADVIGGKESTRSWWEIGPDGLRIIVDGEADLVFSWEMLDRERSACMSIMRSATIEVAKKNAKATGDVIE